MIENDDSYPRWLVLSRREAEFALSCLMGEAEFYPFFDDLNHHIKFTPDGIQESHRDGRQWKDYYFTFPGEIIAEYLSIALIRGYYRDGNDKKFTIEISPDRIYKEKCKFAPRLYWNFGDPYNSELSEIDVGKVKSKIVTDLKNPNQSRLKHCLKSLVRIAKNYSSGIPSEIRISFDSYNNDDDNIPSSYFWNITNQDSSILHGGIIAHPRYKDNNRDNEIESWEYSTHT
jgi:hypothetical protein